MWPSGVFSLHFPRTDLSFSPQYMSIVWTHPFSSSQAMTQLEESTEGIMEGKVFAGGREALP